jgi:hypothetical protein
MNWIILWCARDARRQFPYLSVLLKAGIDLEGIIGKKYIACDVFSTGIKKELTFAILPLFDTTH